MNQSEFIKGFEEAYLEAKKKFKNEFKLNTSAPIEQQIEDIQKEEAKYMANEVGKYIYQSIAKINQNNSNTQ